MLYMYQEAHVHVEMKKNCYGKMVGRNRFWECIESIFDE